MSPDVAYIYVYYIVIAYLYKSIRPIIKIVVICCLSRYRLRALQQSGLYEVFAENKQPRRRANSECKLKYNDVSIFIVSRRGDRQTDPRR